MKKIVFSLAFVFAQLSSVMADQACPNRFLGQYQCAGTISFPPSYVGLDLPSEVNVRTKTEIAPFVAPKTSSPIQYSDVPRVMVSHAFSIEESDERIQQIRDALPLGENFADYVLSEYGLQSIIVQPGTYFFKNLYYLPIQDKYDDETKEGWGARQEVSCASDEIQVIASPTTAYTVAGYREGGLSVILKRNTSDVEVEVWDSSFSGSARLRLTCQEI